MNATQNTLPFAVGKKVVLTADWSHPDTPKVFFPKGTQGEVEEVLHERGEAKVSVKSDQSGTFFTIVPLHLLRV